MVCYIFFYIKNGKALYKKEKPKKKTPHNPIIMNSFASHEAKQLNKFALQIYEATDPTHDQNHCISPLSITLALAILRDSATPQVQEEIETLIKDIAPRYFDELITNVETNKPTVQCGVCNSLWQQVEQKSDFLSYLKSVYRCDVNAPIKADKMMEWIRTKTRGIIQQFDMPRSVEEVIDATHVINTIFFDAAWHNDWWSSTFVGNFMTENGDNIPKKVKSMFLVGETLFDYIETKNGWQCVDIELEGGFAITFLINKKSPKSTPTLEDIEATLYNKEYANVNLRVPIFKIETNTLSLKDPLQALGVNKLFDGSDPNQPRLPFIDSHYVKDIKHKVVIDVTQRGVRAAAATVAECGDGCAEPEETIYLSLDQPFYFIVHKKDIVLFMGHLVQPNTQWVSKLL